MSDTYRVTLWEGSFTVSADSEEEARTEALQTVAESLDLFVVERQLAHPPVADQSPISESMREDFNAMVAEMRDPEAKACGCGFPVKPCLRIMLRNGPPFPSRPCEPS